MKTLVFESGLRVPREVLWARVSTMEGVNDELLPLARMTYPPHAAGMSLADAPVGRLAFHSWILLFGWLPIDRHSLTLEEVRDGAGFVEASCSWSQRVWRHVRTIEDTTAGCVVRDELTFSTRIGWMEPVVAVMVRTLFAHRHRRLRSRFGAATRR